MQKKQSLSATNAADSQDTRCALPVREAFAVEGFRTCPTLVALMLVCTLPIPIPAAVQPQRSSEPLIKQWPGHQILPARHGLKQVLHFTPTISPFANARQSCFNEDPVLSRPPKRKGGWADEGKDILEILVRVDEADHPTLSTVSGLSPCVTPILIHGRYR